MYVDTYCVIPEPRMKLLLIAVLPYSAMIDSFTVITALMKRLKNNLQLFVGHWEFNFRPNQHLSNKGIKQVINSRRTVLISYWRVKNKVNVRDFF